jgi:hypothetical protein
MLFFDVLGVFDRFVLLGLVCGGGIFDLVNIGMLPRRLLILISRYFVNDGI